LNGVIVGTGFCDDDFGRPLERTWSPFSSLFADEPHAPRRVAGVMATAILDQIWTATRERHATVNRFRPSTTPNRRC
jgi:hypothetical protein